MSSNIYYPERKLMHDSAKPSGWREKLGRALGINQDSEAPFKSAIITIENIIKILDLPTIGLSVDKNRAPFHNFSFRSASMDCELPDIGHVFVPMNIHMTDGMRDYFIVLIDNELEIRYWPGYRLPLSDPDKLKTYTVTDNGILADIEKSFAALLDTTGVNKSFDEKYKDVRPTLFEKADLERFLVLAHPGYEAALLEDVYTAAQTPSGFYKVNAIRMREHGYEEPFEYMYLQLLLDGLDSANVVRTLDRRATREDIEFAITAISGGRYVHMFTIRDGHDADTLTFLQLAAGRMVNKGMTLLRIDNRSSAYNLVLVKEGDAVEVMEVGAKCGLKIEKIL